MPQQEPKHPGPAMHAEQRIAAVGPTAPPVVQEPTLSIKVLHVYRTYYPQSQGGLEEVIRQICVNSKNHGIESRVLSLADHPAERIVKRPEARVYQSKLSFELASCGFSTSALGYFRKLLKWADIVHYHFPWPFADLLHFAAGVDKPTILTYHSDIVRQKVLGRLYSPLMHKFLASVDRIVCTSPNYFATSEVLTRYSHKVDIVPIGIEQESYEKVSDEVLRDVESRYGSDFFLFVGVLRYYKGLHILLDAIKDAPYRVIVAGSGPTEKELVKQAQRMGLTNVTFAGHVSNSEKSALFTLCRGVVFPSYLRAEAFGVTLLEGAMFGRALISTEVGTGTSHVNMHETTGLVVPPGSSKAMRQAMDRMWENPAETAEMGKQARLRFEKLFTGRLMGARYADVYAQLQRDTQRAG